jgi:hypothetical protein
VRLHRGEESMRLGRLLVEELRAACPLLGLVSVVNDATADDFRTGTD